MSLRIIAKSAQIQRWITDRNGTPARKQGSDADLRVLFGNENGGYDPISFDDLVEIINSHHLVLMVEEEPGKTFHKFINRS